MKGVGLPCGLPLYNWINYINNYIGLAIGLKWLGAAEKTRTSTGVTPQRPQRCPFTNKTKDLLNPISKLTRSFVPVNCQMYDNVYQMCDNKGGDLTPFCPSRYQVLTTWTNTTRYGPPHPHP